jgi:hypothetical protein
VRSDDRSSGVDPALGGPVRIGDRWEGSISDSPPSPHPQLPPGTGWLASTSDPVVFGSTDVVSFTALGDASSGSLFVSDGRIGAAIVLYGRRPCARVSVRTCARRVVP